MGLRYGEPPLEEDCEDVGEVIVPLKLTMPSTPELQQREKSTLNLVGGDLSKWARTRIAVRKLEKHNKNVKTRITGLGTLLVGREGWEVIE